MGGLCSKGIRRRKEEDYYGETLEEDQYGRRHDEDYNERFMINRQITERDENEQRPVENLIRAGFQHMANINPGTLTLRWGLP